MLRLALVLAALVTVLPMTVPPRESGAVPFVTPAAPRVEVFGGSGAERARLAEALERFRENHLALPDLEVHFSDNPDECDGHLGRFHGDGVRQRVVVCSDLEFVVTHELAHAWEAANLDDGQRDRYLAARGLPTWNDHETPWNERGVEDAAFVIQQNLMATDPPLTSAMWTERADAYELLTGTRSPLRERWGGQRPSPRDNSDIREKSKGR